MRYQVAAGQEPWLTSFERLSTDTRASATYLVRGNPAWTDVQRGGPHGSEFETDANAAYLNALMWAITEDEAHEFARRAARDIVEATGLPKGTSVVAINTDTLTLASPWSGPSELAFHHDQRNYCVQFSFEVP